MKFNEFAQTYKLHIQAHLKPRTVEQYSDILRRILVPRFGKRELTDVRLHDLRHSYATCAVEVGISMPVIGGFSGTRQSRRHHAIFTRRNRLLKKLRNPGQRFDQSEFRLETGEFGKDCCGQVKM